jgi:hypothetical protein
VNWFRTISNHPSYILSLMTCWRIDLHLYWVLGVTVLRVDPWVRFGCLALSDQENLFDQPDPCQIFISLRILHQRCSSGHVDEFGLLNRLISISEAQDFPVWISSVKVGIPAARRIFAQVRGTDSRDFFWPRTELKSAKMRDLIEEGYWKLERGLDHHKWWDFYHTE